MTTKFRTLLLLGFTALAASLSGCFVETTSGNGSDASCASERYFEVRWLVDNGVGTAPQACAALPPVSVGLVLNSGVSYAIPGSCNDTYTYNYDGVTQAGVPTGSYVTSFDLLRSDTGAVLSRGGTWTGPSADNPAMPSCSHVTLTYEFPLM